MTLSYVTLGKRLVVEFPLRQLQQPVRPTLNKHPDELRIATSPEVSQNLGQLTPTSDRKSTAEARDVVAVEVKVGVMCVKDLPVQSISAKASTGRLGTRWPSWDLPSAVHISEGLHRAPGHQMAQLVTRSPT